jgi:hypothetical protein
MRRTFQFARTVMLASLAAGGLPGCDGGTGYQEEQGEPSTPQGESLTFSAYETAADGGALQGDAGTTSLSSSGALAPDAGPNFSDEEISAILAAINEDEIVLGRAAQLQGTDPRVRSLGAEVVTTHQDARARQLALGILPVPSDQSSAYVQSGLTLLRTLEGQPAGPEFDYAYLELQVMLDAIVINQIDHKWLVSTENAELNAELVTTRDATQAHLDQAVVLRNALRPVRDAGAGPAADAGTSEPPAAETTDEGAAADDADPAGPAL